MHFDNRILCTISAKHRLYVQFVYFTDSFVSGHTNDAVFKSNVQLHKFEEIQTEYGHKMKKKNLIIY